MNPNSKAQQPSEDADYDGPILPGSRWRQEGMSGHVPQFFTVVRVGARSVMLVVEGGGHNKGSKHRPGQQFNVVIEDFRRTHRLVAQPKGFRPEIDLMAGEIYDRSVKPLSAATMGEARNQALARVAASATSLFRERSARANAYGPLPRVVPPLGEGYEAVPTLPGTTTETPPADPADIHLDTVPWPEATPAEPAKTADAEDGLEGVFYEPQEPTEEEEEPAVNLSNENLAAFVAAGDAIMGAVLPPAQEEEPDPGYSPGYSPGQTEPTEGAEPEQEADPIEQFMESGRVLVERANSKISRAKAEIDALNNALSAAQAEYDRLVRQKERIEGAVLAAIATAGDDEPPEVEDDLPTVPLLRNHGDPPKPVLPEAPLREVVAAQGQPRFYGTTGFVATPGKKAQREWVLDLLVERGRLAVADHRDDFAREYGTDPDRSTKNISSILADHLKQPKGRWPAIVRERNGVYALAPSAE